MYINKVFSFFVTIDIIPVEELKLIQPSGRASLLLCYNRHNSCRGIETQIFNWYKNNKFSYNRHNSCRGIETY